MRRHAASYIPPIEPYQSRFLAGVRNSRDLLRRKRQPRRQAGRVSCTAAPAPAPIRRARQFFDPQHYRIVVFDQRGCGRSRPSASLDREHHLALGGRHRTAAQTFRASSAGWCSAAPGAARLGARLRGGSTRSESRSWYCAVYFLLRYAEIRWFYQHGASDIFPRRLGNLTVISIPCR